LSQGRNPGRTVIVRSHPGPDCPGRIRQLRTAPSGPSPGGCHLLEFAHRGLVAFLGAIWPFGVGSAQAALRAFCASSPPRGFYGGTKHQWLYLHQLDSIGTVRRLVSFYVQQHNQVMPHSAFNGLTPDEVYFEKSQGVLHDLTKQRGPPEGNGSRPIKRPRAQPVREHRPLSDQKRQQPNDQTQLKEAARTFAGRSSKCSTA
jgi:hypothetical protein